jgi:predicted metalloprotease with PDZ domain
MNCSIITSMPIQIRIDTGKVRLSPGRNLFENTARQEPRPPEGNQLRRILKPRLSARPFIYGLVLSLASPLSTHAEGPPPISITVDASEVNQQRIEARMVFPAKPGPLTLLYPKWLPGTHGPGGPIGRLGGLKLSASGKPVAWQRDPLEMFAFHCQVPEAATALEVELAYILTNSQDPFEVSIGVVASRHVAIINWNAMLVYPKGGKADELIYAAQLQLPKGWKFGSRLETVRDSSGTVEFKPVSLSRLIDCPVIAGEHFRTIPLTSEPTPHQIDLACEDAKTLELNSEFIEHMKRLVAESIAFFDARHYTNFHFLLGLSDRIPHFGLEHHECSVNTASPRAFTGDPAAKWWLTFLLPHEYLHSWNGKYRRPEGLVSPDYQGPHQTDLLWVYEGLTQYLGLVMDARSGLWTPEQFRENLASTGADLDRRSGRTWRPLIDTALASQIHTAGSRHTWRGGSDYYYEGVFIWLEADGIIRKQTQGKRNLQDFCRAFFGGEDGKVVVKPYSFDEVMTSLEEIAPYDWRGFFTSRLNATERHAPLAGLEMAGWKLVFTDARQESGRDRDGLDLSYGLGCFISREGNINNIGAHSPAAKGGLKEGMRVIAVNGRRFSDAAFRQALRASAKENAKLDLLIENGDEFKTISLDYHGGEKYPKLERIQDRPDVLAEIIKPQKE